MDRILCAATNNGVVVARRQNNTWQETNRALVSQPVTSVSAQGDTVLAGTREGIHRSVDRGQTWHLASQGLIIPYVRWLAHHPDGSGRVLAGTEPAAIFLSTDGGQTWTERPEVTALREQGGWYLPYSSRAGCIRGFAFHGARAYAAAEVGGLLRSDDGGGTWRLVEGSSGSPHNQPEGFVHPDVHSVAVHPSSPDLVLAPTGGGFYRSLNGGLSWDLLYRCYCRAVWHDPADTDHMIMGPADSVDRNGRIEETRNGGQTWAPATVGLQVPWPRHMVERFVQIGHDLLAVLSNGDLLAAPLSTLEWRQILPDAGWVRTVAAAPVEG